MDSVPHRVRKSSLTAAEREVVLTVADDEDAWTVFTDSRRAFSGRLLRVARALGIEPIRTGVGWAFSLPLKAIRVAAPQRGYRPPEESLKNLRRRAKRPEITRGAEGKVALLDGPPDRRVGARLRSRTPVATGSAEGSRAPGVP